MLPSNEPGASPTATPVQADHVAGMSALRYRLTRADYTRLSQVVRRRLPARLRWTWHAFSALLWLLLASVIFAYLRVRELLDVLLGEVPSVAKWLSWGALIALFATLTALRWYQRQALRHGFSEEGDFLSPRVLRFDEHTLIFESRRQRTEMAWSALVARDEDAHNCYLFLEPAVAVILPKAALAPVRAQFDPLFLALPVKPQA